MHLLSRISRRGQLWSLIPYGHVYNLAEERKAPSFKISCPSSRGSQLRVPIPQRPGGLCFVIALSERLEIRCPKAKRMHVASSLERKHLEPKLSRSFLATFLDARMHTRYATAPKGKICSQAQNAKCENQAGVPLSAGSFQSFARGGGPIFSVNM